MIQGVLFDMDGLMFDTEPLWSESWAPALALFGLPFKEGLDQSARGSAGENLRAVIRSYYGPDCPAEEIIAAFDKIAHEKFLSPVPKKPGLDNLLDWLEARGIPMGGGLLQRGSGDPPQPGQLADDQPVQGHHLGGDGDPLQA